MLTFYKFQNERAIPYKGEPPYIHWTEPFSTGLYRIHSFYFKCESDTVAVEILNQPTQIFYIYNSSPKPASVDDSWGLVEDYLYQHVVLYPNAVDGQYKWYQLILVAKSDSAGEFIVDILIDGQVYKFGSEFYGQNESLTINLANKGFEVPDFIDRAIYTTDVYKENPDWILLNRKFRELLMNYMEVIGNKGSYKSLINSLDWFDYGKLVELREVWKYETPDGTKLFDAPIQETLSSEVKRNLYNCAKTTYFALRHQTNIVGTTISNDANPLPELIDTVYEWDPQMFIDLQNDHTISSLASIWSQEEMRLKMVLLGNFFETYFMPIHTNLIRSVVETIDAFNIYDLGFCGSDSYHEECFSEAGNFDLDWGSDQSEPSNPSDPSGGDGSGQFSKLNLYLDEVHVIAGVPRNEPYGQALENTTISTTLEPYNGLPYTQIVACHMLDEDNVSFPNTSFEAFKAAYAQQIFNGIGAVATATMTFPEPIISGECDTNVYGEFITTKFTEANPLTSFKVSFLFPKPGDFVMILRFVGQSGRKYSKRIDIHVVNNLQPDIDIMLLKALVPSGSEVPNPFDATNATLSPNKYMYARTQPLDTNIYKDDDSYMVDYQGEYLYSQYIPIRPYKDQDGVEDDAPYLTRVYTAKFVGADCVRRMTEFESCRDNNGLIFNQVTWSRCGYENINDPDNSEWCWIQYIYKVRGRYGDFQYAGVDEHYEKEVFIPELMRLEEPESTVPDYYPVVCMPVIKVHLKDSAHNGYIKTIPYSHHIDSSHMDYMWEFFSWNLQTNIGELSKDIQEPFMAWNQNNPIPPGYYTIKFKYNFGDGPKEIVKNTSFKILKR